MWGFWGAGSLLYCEIRALVGDIRFLSAGSVY